MQRCMNDGPRRPAVFARREQICEGGAAQGPTVRPGIPYNESYSYGSYSTAQW
jgi:hypothetical protein